VDAFFVRRGRRCAPGLRERSVGRASVLASCPSVVGFVYALYAYFGGSCPRSDPARPPAGRNHDNTGCASPGLIAAVFGPAAPGHAHCRAARCGAWAALAAALRSAE